MITLFLCVYHIYAIYIYINAVWCWPAHTFRSSWPTTLMTGSSRVLYQPGPCPSWSDHKLSILRWSLPKLSSNLWSGGLWLYKSKQKWWRAETRSREGGQLRGRELRSKENPGKTRPKRSSFRFQGYWLLGKISNACKLPTGCILTIRLLYPPKKPLLN